MAKTLTEELIIPQRVTWAKMEAALHALTSGEAKEELTLAFQELKNKAQTAWTDDMWTKDVVHSFFVQSKLKETYTDQAKLTAALSGTKATKEAFLKLCYKEAVFRLQTLFFGEDAFGRNVSHQLKQVIATLRPEPSKGIEKYHRCITELQSYVPYTLWELGMKLKNAENPEPLSTEDFAIDLAIISTKRNDII